MRFLNKKNVDRLIDECRNILALTVKWWIYNIKSQDEVKILKQNEQFRNIHSGKRCFILGNGPSLKSVELSALADEYVFTVNQVARNEDYPKLRSNYHFWVDPNFFDIDVSKPEDLELLNTMKGVNTYNNRPKVFYPIGQRGFVKKHHLDDALDISYFKSTLIFTESFGKIDYCKFTPGCFGTVVQWCITMAIYMGFSEIYLLGCENTGIITNVQSAARQTVTEYAYTVTDNEQKRMESMLGKRSLYDFVVMYAETLKRYDLLFKYCKKRGISLVNCTDHSAIDCIPYRPLGEVLKESR